MTGLQVPVIVEGARTPFLDSGGAYSPLMTYQLAAHSIAGLMAKVDIDPHQVGMVTMGTVLHEIETSNVARESLLTAGLPATIPAYTTSMAGLSASVGFANLCDMVALGRIQAGIAGGVESFSDIPIRFAQPIRRAAMKLRQDSSMGNVFKQLLGMRPKDLIPELPKGTDFTTKKVMGECAEAMVKKFGVSRADCDLFTQRSHQLALQALAGGHYKADIMPVQIPGQSAPVREDNTPRADCQLPRLQTMKPIFDREQGVITAAGSSRFTDGSAALMVASQSEAQSLGLKPLAIVRDTVFSAVKDLESEMLLGPAITIPKLLARNRLTMADVDVWELHEAFAAQVLVNIACMAQPRFADEYFGGKSVGELPIEKLNAWGGSLALGNPFAATGIRLLMTAARRLHAENARFAVVSSCAGGGLGAAILLEHP